MVAGLFRLGHHPATMRYTGGDLFRPYGLTDALISEETEHRTTMRTVVVRGRWWIYGLKAITPRLARYREAADAGTRAREPSDHPADDLPS